MNNFYLFLTLDSVKYSNFVFKEFISYVCINIYSGFQWRDIDVYLMSSVFISRQVSFLASSAVHMVSF
jgi:hypothetical protein